MRILGVAKTESDLEIVELQLKLVGLYDRYESQIRGQLPSLIMVSVRDVEEKEQVRGILERAGLTEIFYQEELPTGN
jgi:hypothetical protein